MKNEVFTEITVYGGYKISSSFRRIEIEKPGILSIVVLFRNRVTKRFPYTNLFTPYTKSKENAILEAKQFIDKSNE